MATTRTPKRLPTDELHKLWHQYKDTGDRGLRDRLILTLAPLVKFIVYRKIRDIPARLEADDFISVGLEAIIASIDRYDPDKGATLEQFAWTRIHGSVLDEMRRQDWAPRSVRRWERDIEKAVEEFNGAPPAPPTREELSEALGISVQELRRHREEIAVSTSRRSTRSCSATTRSAIERIDTIAADDPRAAPERPRRRRGQGPLP